MRIIEKVPTPLFATVSGAHLYGFDSPDSDYDLRGAFVAPLDQVLRLRAPEETISVMENRDGLELDWVAHDIHKFARLMTRKTGYVLEQLYSPLVVLGGAWLDELRDIGQGFMIRPLFHHYQGFARNQRSLLDEGEHIVKRPLYCYRVYCTGIHALQTGVLESNLTALNQQFGIAEVSDLVKRKKEGGEKGELESGEAEKHRTRLDQLQIQLEVAFETSALPETASSMDALDDFVVRARMELGRD